MADDALLYAALDLAHRARYRSRQSPFGTRASLPSRLHDLVLNTCIVRDGQKLALVKSRRLLLPSSLAEPRPWPRIGSGVTSEPASVAGLFSLLGLGAHYGGVLRGARYRLHGAGLAARLARLRAVLPDIRLVALRSRAELQRAAGAAMAAALVAAGPSMARGKPGLGASRAGSSAAPCCAASPPFFVHGVQQNPQQNWPEARVCLAALAGRWRGGVARLGVSADPSRLRHSRVTHTSIRQTRRRSDEHMTVVLSEPPMRLRLACANSEGTRIADDLPGPPLGSAHDTEQQRADVALRQVAGRAEEGAREGSQRTHHRRHYGGRIRLRHRPSGGARGRIPEVAPADACDIG